MTIRKPQPDDQKNTHKAYGLLLETIQLNPGIDGALWVSAALILVVDGFVNSGLSFDEFTFALDDVKANYRDLFD
jgi:hypothetical protein